MKKNVWILNHYAGLGSGRHYKFACILKNRGYNVQLFAASTIHNNRENRITDKPKYIVEEQDGVKCVYIKARDYEGSGKARIKNMLDYSIGLMSVSKKFGGEKPDVIYASSVHPLTWLAGYKLAKRYNAKFIAETRDLWPETLVSMGRIKKNSLPAKLLYKLEKFIYNKADKLIFTFPGGKDYVESVGLDSSKVRYINNGVDIELFDKNKTKFNYIDKDLDDDKFFKVVYTGSIGAYNGIEYLVEAAKIIRERGYDHIRIMIWGNGTNKNELFQQVSDYKLENISFKDAVNKSYIPNILSKSDLNLLLGIKVSINKYGLSPNKLFDYFASGKPTISNRIVKHDIIQKYEAGISIEDESAEALAEAIIKFSLMNKDEYLKYCNNSIEAAKKFDFKELTNKLEEIILS